MAEETLPLNKLFVIGNCTFSALAGEWGFGTPAGRTARTAGGQPAGRQVQIAGCRIDDVMAAAD